jgi:hypothetical protein
MKNLNFLAFFIILSFRILAQSPDKKWYILDSAAVQNFNTLSYGPKVQINDFTISNILLPGTPGPNGVPSDQIFVIYTDSTFTLKDVTNEVSTNQSINYNVNQVGKYVKCLSWTDKYDREDPPQSITVNNSGGSTLQNSSTPTMIVHQNAVPNRDVVVVIPRHYKDSCYKIKFDYNHYVFDTLNLFNKNPLFPYNLEDFNYVQTDGEISLNINNSFKYSFIALKTRDINVGSYDTTTLYLKCESMAGNPIIDSLKVPILKAHDPNYVKVQCVSLPQNSINTVKYEVACFNDGLAQAINPEIKTTFPSNLDGNSVCIDSYNIAGVKYAWKNSYKLTYSLSPNNGIKFKFLEDLAPNHGASIQFCVKGNPGVNLLDAVESLEPSHDSTNFNGIPYSIDNFYDLRYYKRTRIPSNCNCNCKRRVQNHCLLPWFNRKKHK